VADLRLVIASPSAVRLCRPNQGGTTEAYPFVLATEGFFFGALMKTQVSKTVFGSITIDGQEYEHDVLIRLDGRVKRRKKKLSKEVYGTSHTISLAEAEHIYEPGAEVLLIGSGTYGMVSLSPEAANFLESQGVRVELQPTGSAVETWNNLSGSAIALFHITC
jgi:hypothetical protein